jgi:tetratricopeptide (TPR) repeat protein
MFRTSHYSRSSAVIAIVIGLIISSLFAKPAHISGQTVVQSSTNLTILDLIYRQKYDDAITRLEQVLESDPRNGEALTYLATANLYQTLNFTKARTEFEEAFKAGGGATFFVTHSHEALTTTDVVDYCRGWLHLRRDTVEFVPIEGSHGFKVNYNQVDEFKRNRLTKKAFHIKVGEKSQNFRGRSNSDLEALLIVALYRIFAGN